MPDEKPRLLWLARRVACALPPTNRRTPRLSFAVTTLGALAALGALESSDAQRADQPRISVAPTIVAEPASLALLAIQIGPPEALPSNCFVRLRGLPPSVSLTEGYAIGPGSWAIPLFGLPTLRANVPAGVSGRSEIVISLVAMDGTLLAEARTALMVGPPAMLPSAEKARAERLLARGEEYLASGNVAGARDYFERAAEIGLGVAALRLATTYDPAELQRLQTQGIIPDRALARKWYERARQLGAPEAEERLAKLRGS